MCSLANRWMSGSIVAMASDVGALDWAQSLSYLNYVCKRRWSISTACNLAVHAGGYFLRLAAAGRSWWPVHGGLMPEHVDLIRREKPHKWLYYRWLTFPTLRRAIAVHCTKRHRGRRRMQCARQRRPHTAGAERHRQPRVSSSRLSRREGHAIVLFGTRSTGKGYQCLYPGLVESPPVC